MLCDLNKHSDALTVLMADPNWNKGFYYDGLPPHTGMKLARRKHSHPFFAYTSNIALAHFYL